MRRFPILMFILLATSTAWSHTIAGPVRPGSPSQHQATMSGEVIVKFMSNSEIGQAGAAAVRGEELPKPRLKNLASSLSDQLNIPVEIKGITSGQEFVLRVDTETLVSQLLEQLKARKAVLNASLLAKGNERRLQEQHQVLVEFVSNSDLARALAKSPGDLRNSMVLDRFIRGLEAELGGTLTGRSPGPDQIILSIDTASLTATLLERLKKRPDVEYAQPNLLLQPLPAGDR